MEATPIESQSSSITSKLNWLRAGVLGANDGIVSTASIIFGVAGAAATHDTLIITGVAAIAAGAMSMATGEYVSVCSQRDVEEAELAREREQLERDPQGELHQLRSMLEARGIESGLAREVAAQLTEQDALAAHADLELGIDPKAVANPWHAAFASMIAFTAGGIIPLLAVVLASRNIEIGACGAAVLLALALTGAISAKLSGAPIGRAISRNVLGGLIGMAVTYGVGRIAGTRV